MNSSGRAALTAAARVEGAGVRGDETRARGGATVGGVWGVQWPAAAEQCDRQQHGQGERGEERKEGVCVWPAPIVQCDALLHMGMEC